MENEPLLMPFQNQPFNGDVFIQQEFIKLRDKFNINYVIETGTCLGYTTEWLGKNFTHVTTIEISEQYRNLALKRISSNTVSVLGDSVEKLTEIIDYGLLYQTIIFLDAHWGDFCPLQDELNIIARSRMKPVIAIHDFVVPNKPEFGYDSYKGQPFTYEWLKPNLDAIYGEDNYDYYYNTGLHEQSAKRGIIYITPKQ